MSHRLNLSDIETSTSLAYIRALATVWLEVRQNILCELSCEDGEWPGSVAIYEALERMKVLAKITSMLEDAAECCVSEVDTDALIWSLLDDVKDKLGHVAEVEWTV